MFTVKILYNMKLKMSNIILPVYVSSDCGQNFFPNFNTAKILQID